MTSSERHESTWRTVSTATTTQAVASPSTMTRVSDIPVHTGHYISIMAQDITVHQNGITSSLVFAASFKAAVFCDCRDGYNKWRDAKKPSAILAELCRKNAIPSPEYRELEIKVLNKIFKVPDEAFPEGMFPLIPLTCGSFCTKLKKKKTMSRIQSDHRQPGLADKRIAFHCFCLGGVGSVIALELSNRWAVALMVIVTKPQSSLYPTSVRCLERKSVGYIETMILKLKIIRQNNKDL